MQEYGPWKIVGSQAVYQDPWLKLRRDDVIRPDGNPGFYSVLELKPGVTVLALDADGQVHLTEEFHYAVGRVTLECVSGGREDDEDPQVAAERELAEELGITARLWTWLGVCDPFTSSVCSPTHLYLAQELTLGTAAPEGSEIIRHVRLSFADALQQVLSGGITHAPSALALLKTWILIRGEVPETR